VCAGHEALIIAAADVISLAVSGASGCEGTAFVFCGLEGVVNVSVDMSRCILNPE